MKITKEMIETSKSTYKKCAKNRLAENAVTTNGIHQTAKNWETSAESTQVFSIDLPTGEVANQKQSGRCWMFAALNTFRHKILQDFKLKEFELSQSYTFFWDKYEKSNWFFEQILATGKSELTDRKVAFLLQTPQQDGGQWDMIVSLIEKYGVVPKSVYPESTSSSASAELNKYLNKLLRKGALVLRTLIEENKSTEEIQAKKAELLDEIYRFLSISLGNPPEVFDFEYRNEDNEYFIERNMTPKSFYEKFVGVDLGEYVSIINAPTKDKPYNKSYTVEMLGNVVGGKQVKYLNVDMKEFKRLATRQLESGETVWFGCDVGQSSDRKSGIMATGIYDIDGLFELEVEMNKAERLDYGESLMTHAMVLTGVNVVDGETTKWKVENSWGKEVGEKGFFVASDKWMDEFTYQIVVRRSFLSEEQLKAFDAEPIVLAPWDPMGSLAN
ncbi:bleomycin hydrolase [Pilibacter termitis]|uniref:Aminopeptidase n=1 Tax=Pilibacter termitis TaxID=263852 RepID=A0A1T4KFD9_9ENTE|nr:bleomycin hydrolase [Pilibacter termitis]